MSAERDEKERTEVPSPRWVAHVREHGAWPNSRELVAACTVLASFAVLFYEGSWLVNRLHALFWCGLREATAVAHGFDLVATRNSMLRAFLKTVPFLLTPVAVAISVGVAQTGCRFRPESLRPSLSRLTGNGAIQGLSGGSSIRVALVAMIKWSMLLSLAVWLVWGELCQPWNCATAMSPRPLGNLAGAPLRVLIKLAVMVVFFGLADYGWAWVRYRGQMRMTRAEAAAEARETEGDPINRRRLRQERANRTHGRWGKTLRTGDLVLVGSGRLALTIRTSAQGQHTLMAKAVGTVADTLERAAQSRGTPILRNAALARTIADRCGAGSELPTEFSDQISRIQQQQPEKLAVRF